MRTWAHPRHPIPAGCHKSIVAVDRGVLDGGSSRDLVLTGPALCRVPPAPAPSGTGSAVARPLPLDIPSRAVGRWEVGSVGRWGGRLSGALGRSARQMSRRRGESGPCPASPVASIDFPDPFVLPVGGVFYAYATNAGSTNVQLMSSVDLVGWEMLADARPVLPSW